MDAEAGVVDQGVDPQALGVQSLGEGRGSSRRVQIVGDRDGPDAVRLREIVRQGRQGVRAARDQDEVSAVRGDPFGEGASDTRGGARDEGGGSAADAAHAVS